MLSNRRGRQLGRVLATRYEEVVVDRLFEGTTQLTKALQPLMQAAEQTLELDERKRARTVVRIDAGGGSVDDVNWLLERGYQVHGKDYSSSRAQRLAASVQYWVDDPHVPGRQVGWVYLPASEYVRPVWRIAVRCRRANGHWGIGVLISTLSPVDVLILTQAAAPSKLRHYGILRMVRDVFHVSGFLVLDASCHIVQIVLNQAAPLAPILVGSLQELLAPTRVAVCLGQT